MVKPVRSRSKRRSGGSVLPAHLSGALKKLLLVSLPYLLSLVLTGFFFGGVVAYALNSPTFELRDVRIDNFPTLRPEDAFRFCELSPGENLLKIDLVNVQQLIKRKHPQYKEVIVRRVLPNRLEIALKRRAPAAQVAALGRYVQVDKELVVLPGALPMIATTQYRLNTPW